MQYFIDSHAHIYLPEFDADRQIVIQQARQAGVEKILMPNIDESSVERMLNTEEQFPGICYAMMGLHPCSVNGQVQQQLYAIESWLTKRSFIAIGEMGTDRYWDTTWWDEQIEAFRVQAGWAKQFRLPLVIHCRQSLDETLALLESLQDGSLTGVFHCFTGSLTQAQRVLQLGFYLGIGGVATFKNGGLDRVLPELPVEKIILETDSPYLAPVPHRGKRNVPAYLTFVAEKVASLYVITTDALRDQITRNTLQLFEHVR
ncbi:MAG: TatD family hydrolase [Cyclobacteriaceae bacterium]|nr:TatD family hydrolase [Cyclobacteriaceae bacterium]MCX7636812.1 TatD family hydrolase [Cyclobacteriaceae bacterium]MDW8331297.1 TatD family hydrolase [Cyclobacteriaceae bacterium]